MILIMIIYDIWYHVYFHFFITYISAVNLSDALILIIVKQQFQTDKFIFTLRDKRGAGVAPPPLLLEKFG